MALLTTVTSVWPAPWIFLRSTEAPIAEEPMPASQAKTMVRISRVARGGGWHRPDRRPAPATDDFLPLIASMLRGGGGEVAVVLGLVHLEQDGCDREGRGSCRR